MNFPHIPVLMAQVLGVFQDKELSVFVDGTLGAGGHAEAILRHHPEIKRYIGIDQDPDALKIAEKRLSEWSGKVSFVSGNFSDIEAILQSLRVENVDGMLLDLGVSSMQLDRPEKGFSFSKPGPLDMRMDPDQELTAEEIVNSWEERELGRIFREYGEEKKWRVAAKAIVEARKSAPITTTIHLKEVLEKVLWRGKKKGINPLTLVFQALRICVNRELERLEEILPVMIEKLNPEGRLAVISFHSLEDRIVKNAFRYAASDKENTSGIGGVFISKEPQVRIVTKKAMAAEAEEIDSNPRSRSAKMRAIEKI